MVSSMASAELSMDGRYAAPPYGGRSGVAWVSPDARVDIGAQLQPPVFIDAGSVVKSGSVVGPYAVIGSDSRIDEGATISRSIVWPRSHIGAEAAIHDSILGAECRVGSNATITHSVIGNSTNVADFSRVGRQSN